MKNENSTQTIKELIEFNKKQTMQILNALSELTDWMDNVQKSIENIDKRLRLAEKTNDQQDKESEFYVTKDEFRKDMSKLHKFTEDYCDSVQSGDFYN